MMQKAKIAFLQFGLEKPTLPHGISWLVSDTQQTSQITKREENILKERMNLILKAGANVILTTGAIDDTAAKILVEAKVMGVRRVLHQDMKRLAEATGGQPLLLLADLEGGESFDPSCLGEAESVIQEPVSDHELLIFRGTKTGKSASVLLRGANEMMLDEMHRSLNDALMATKRVLESKQVVPGGGAVEAAVAMHLESFAESVGTREQLAIAEYAQALLVIPKLLAVNAAKDATELVAKLCTLHVAAQKHEDRKHYARFGLELITDGKVQDNVMAGILEPTLIKLKSLKFATEAAVAIMRIDDFFKLNPKPEPAHPDHDDH